MVTPVSRLSPRATYQPKLKRPPPHSVSKTSSPVASSETASQTETGQRSRNRVRTR